MATKTIEINVCDICGEETEGFYYWESHNSALGVISESRLAIDICEDCCRHIDIPDKMMYDRGETCNISKEDIEKQVKKWRDDLGINY